MNDDSGWRELSTPSGRGAARPAGVGRARLPESLRRSKFGRLARVHGLNAAGDGALALALAGSIFFSIDPTDARWRVALYLVCTVAPFAVVTPLIGPLLDRVPGGRRAMIIGALAGRSILAVLMFSHVDTLWLFPEAFGVLIFQKAYGIAKSALVPRLVEDQDELVEANAKLALISGLCGGVGVAIGGFFSLFGGPAWSAAVAAVIFAFAVLNAFQVPKMVVAEAPIAAEEKAELRSRGITLAATAMAALRAAVGFVTFLLAFELRGGVDGVPLDGFGSSAGATTALGNGVDIVKVTGIPGAPTWHFGLVAAAAAIFALGGARFAPRLREQYPEENILLGVLTIAFSAALIAAWAGDLFGAVLMAGAIGIAAATGKLVFDAIVQRDAPAANWGRSFARFEARFQLSWAVGAFIPAVAPLSGRASVGYLIVAAIVGGAGLWYFAGSRGATMPTLRNNDDKIELTDDDLRPSPPRAPAGTDEVMARYGTAPPAASRTIPQFEPTQEFEMTAPVVEAPPEPPRNWDNQSSQPIVSSNDGVEIDPDSYGWTETPDDER